MYVERGSPDPGIHFFGSWRPFSPICARLRTIRAKPHELGNYSGRLHRLIAHRFRTVEFERVFVHNSSFEIFPRNLRSVSRNPNGWILRALWSTFPRVTSSNVISALSCLKFCDNFLRTSVLYPLRRLAISPRVWLHSLLRRRSFYREFCVSSFL